MAKSISNVFVALLRGVNVGGNNMISMSSLKKSFEALGFNDVVTYINSGNIIFKSKEADARKLESKIEKMLSNEYQLDSRVVLRSLSEMEKIVQNLPENWTPDRDWRYNVIFLRHSIDSEDILRELGKDSRLARDGGKPTTEVCHALLLWKRRVKRGGTGVRPRATAAPDTGRRAIACARRPEIGRVRRRGGAPLPRVGRRSSTLGC